MVANVANLVLIFVGITGVVCWLRLLWLWRTGRCPEIRKDSSTIVRWGIGSVLIYFMVWLLFQIIGQVTTMTIMGVESVDDLSNAQRSTVHLASSGGGLLGALLVFVLVVAVTRHKFAEFGISLKGILEGLAIGFVAFAMSAPIVWGLFEILRRLIPYEHVAKTMLEADQSTWGIVKVAIPAILVASIVEELFFRVLLQGWFQKIRVTALLEGRPIDHDEKEKKSHSWCPLSIAFSSILFALAHSSQGPAPYALFLFSLAVGYVYQRTGNIIACIVMHMMLNTIGITFMVIQAIDNST